jgi:hypothetical protein
MRSLIDTLQSYDIECRLTLGDLATTVLPIRSVFGIERFGDYGGLLRISVGIEPFDNLRKAFTYGLSLI